MHLKILRLRVSLNMSSVAEKLLFTDSGDRYHQQISGIKLIQIGAISILLCQHQSLLHCWKDICGLKLPRRVATSENDRLRIYSPWIHLTPS
jgi:hypothetical protein